MFNRLDMLLCENDNQMCKQENTLWLVKSYRDHRYQCTVLLNSNFSWKPIAHGVPQGSIVDPLLFLLYLNDMHCSSSSLSLLLSANNATITFSGSNLSLFG